MASVVPEAKSSKPAAGLATVPMRPLASPVTAPVTPSWLIPLTIELGMLVSPPISPLLNPCHPALRLALEPSKTLRARSTSTVKSMCPGVSIRFNWLPVKKMEFHNLFILLIYFKI